MLAIIVLRLARWLGTSLDFLLNLQQAYDLEGARRQVGKTIEETVQPRQAVAA